MQRDICDEAYRILRDAGTPAQARQEQRQSRSQPRIVTVPELAKMKLPRVKHVAEGLISGPGAGTRPDRTVPPVREAKWQHRATLRGPVNCGGGGRQPALGDEL